MARRILRLWPLLIDVEEDYEWLLYRTRRRMRLSIDIQEGANNHETEQALSIVGLYAPRGPEFVQWVDDENVAAIIFDAKGEPSIELDRNRLLRQTRH